MFKLQWIRVFFVIGMTVPFSILRNVLLARNLSESEMGLISLLLTITSFIYPLTLYGQHNALVRFLSKVKIEDYQWKRYLFGVTKPGFIITLFAAIICAVIYDLRGFYIIFLIVSIFGSHIGDLYKEVPRSNSKYFESILLHRSIRYLIPISLLILYLFNLFTLRNIILLIFFSYILYSIFIITYIHITNQNGVERIPASVRKDGLFFFGLDASLLIVLSIDKLVVAKLISLEKLAVYFSTLTIMAIFDLTYQALEYVMLPHSNKVKVINFKVLFFQVGFIALAISLFYIGLGPAIIRILYKGKYIEGIRLIPYICIIGFFRLIYVIPSSIIGGKLSQFALKKLFYSNSTIVIFNVLLVIVLTIKWQIYGAITATIISWFLRAAGGIIILINNRKYLNSHIEVVT